jgi:3-deoxy-D-arabino-heptulosonate 7-phosphate (DAHP) synthase class II
MKDSKSSNDVVVELTGVEAVVEIGRVAGQSRTRTGKKKKGKHELEVIKGEEFNVSGDLMNKERIIDRKNNYYKEKVSNIDTGEIVRNIEEPLTEHVGRGHAKNKKNEP